MTRGLPVIGFGTVGKRAGLTAFVIVLSVCAGPQVAAAEIHADVKASDTYTAWSVINATDKTATSGHFCRKADSHVGESELRFGTNTPWPALKAGERTADAFLDEGFGKQSFTTATFEMDGRSWAPQLGRWFRSGGAEWQHIWIFWDQATGRPFLTHEGAEDNIELEPVVGDWCR